MTATGMSDFHKLAAVSLKSQVLKGPAKRKFYRNYIEDKNRLVTKNKLLLVHLMATLLILQTT